MACSVHQLCQTQSWTLSRVTGINRWVVSSQCIWLQPSRISHISMHVWPIKQTLKQVREKTFEITGGLFN